MKKKVGILGATGAVGQRLVALLENHPWFEVVELCASDRSVGGRYGERVRWKLPRPVPEKAASLEIKGCRPPLDCDFVFSALSAETAREVEPEFARAGYPVISNASAYRMKENVPLLIPEINPDHIKLIERQRRDEGYTRGFIVTNPNCSTVGLCFGLAPLEREFGLESVSVTTLQAVSGAGYTGLYAMDIMDNIIPYIAAEEAKLEREPLKILGELSGHQVVEKRIPISAQCNRVAVEDGHTLCVSVALSKKPGREAIVECFRSFRGSAEQYELPSAPRPPIIVFAEEDRPQPRLDRDLLGGMAVSIGRIRECPLLDYKFVALVHNLVRGAAGAALLNAELLHARGLI